MSNQRRTSFFTPLLIGMTPIGLVIGVTEAWRLAGGLVAIIAVQLVLMSLAAWGLVRCLREERKS